MFKKSCIVFALLLVLAVPNVASGTASVNAQSTVDISAQRAVVINADTLEVLYQKEANTKASMASTTKIMTSILALEHGNGQQIVQITPQMLAVEGSSMGLQAGDYITLDTLVAGMLLESGNDSANAVALTLGKSEADFSLQMNAKAKELGMISTNFVTPSGLDEAQHYSTAYDMALLGAYAVKNPDFVSICSAKTMEVSFGNPAVLHTLTNHNRMLSSYKGAIGIKTGFTKKSGRCLVSAAERDGVRFVAVTLNASDDWTDTKKLMDYAFANTKSVPLDVAQTWKMDVVGGTTTQIATSLAYIPTYPAYNTASIQVTSAVFQRPFEYAPVKQGDIVGYACYYQQSRLLCRVPIVATQAVEAVAVAEPATKKETWKQRQNELLQKLKDCVNYGK